MFGFGSAPHGRLPTCEILSLRLGISHVDIERLECITSMAVFTLKWISCSNELLCHTQRACQSAALIDQTLMLSHT